MKDDLERHSRELVDLASDLDVDVSTSNMQSWASEVREHAKRISSFPCNLSDILLSVLSLPVSSSVSLYIHVLFFGCSVVWKK